MEWRVRWGKEAPLVHLPRELSHRDRNRIFNLGYFTWVEQQGIALEDFDRRRNQSFWHALADALPVWDRMIEDFNEKTGVD